MIRLVLKDAEGGEAAFPLVQPLIIGRGVHCDIRLQAQDISRKHARAFPMPDRDFIEDLHSPNGTYINGRRIDGLSPIRHGDVIQMGQEKIRVVQTAAEPADDESTTASNIKAKMEKELEDESDPIKRAWREPLVLSTSKIDPALTQKPSPDSSTKSMPTAFWVALIGMALLLIVAITFILGRA